MDNGRNRDIDGLMHSMASQRPLRLDSDEFFCHVRAFEEPKWGRDGHAAITYQGKPFFTCTASSMETQTVSRHWCIISINKHTFNGSCNISSLIQLNLARIYIYILSMVG